MGLTMREKRAVSKQMARKYKRASKKEKGEILDRLIELSGYNRSYAGRVLKQRNKLQIGTRRTEKKREKSKKYDQKVFVALRRIWSICDGICGKRLGPYLPEIIPVLERCEEIKLEAQVRNKLLQISPATIDRVLAPARKEYQLKARTQTKPGTLLKHQIPIRTFSQWDEGRPGYVEIDLVGHEGGNAQGDYIQTLDVTDVCTGWTEIRAVKNKAQVWVFEALVELGKRLPFALKGIDSDNGGEFINAHLLRYCDKHELTFTRSRPYRKNDNCFVEQKNYSVVRRAVGYQRYDTEEELRTMNQIYDLLNLYTNYFQPTMKLISKERIGSKVKKKYDLAKTPYQRVLNSPFVTKRAKDKIKTKYAQLNPAELRRKMDRLQTKLDTVAQLKRQENQQ